MRSGTTETGTENKKTTKNDMGDNMATLLDEIVVECRCCRGLITLRAWVALPTCGNMETEDDHLELRNCGCGSTLAVEMVPLSELLEE